ncbi:MAG: protein phosphatase 2C domain-containing protein [Gemmatimonadales bacterium]|nr:protein phosphatase 2C domain-containing protein [Gemmatimonadales bacterium]
MPDTRPTTAERRARAASRPGQGDVDSFGLTHPGLVRERNEDQFLIASVHKLMQVHQSSLDHQALGDAVSDSHGFLFLVADGVGGLPGGQEASSAALRAVVDYVTFTMRLYYHSDAEHESRFLEELERSVLRSHSAVRAEGDRIGLPGGLATTLTMVAVIWPTAYLIHVGDSRCYRLRDGTLTQISRDQTMAAALVEAGVLTPQDAERSGLRHMLASVLGAGTAEPMTASSEIQWDDQLLLCSDGLTKHVNDEEIASVLKHEPTAERCCRELVRLALERGGTDNVTVVVSRLKRDVRHGTTREAPRPW